MGFRVERGYGGSRIVNDDTGQVVGDKMAAEDAQVEVDRLNAEAATQAPQQEEEEEATPSYQCEECDHDPFTTPQGLAAHSRVHVST